MPDAGCNVDGVTDQGELELAAAADGAGDHHAGVDPDADSKLPAESLGYKAVNDHCGGHGGVSMIGEVVRRAETASVSLARAQSTRAPQVGQR